MTTAEKIAEARKTEKERRAAAREARILKQAQRREAQTKSRRERGDAAREAMLDRIKPSLVLLDDIEVPFKPYATPPMGQDIFAMGLTRRKTGSTLRLWGGGDNVSLVVEDTDTTLRQAVLHVKEAAAKISRTTRGDYSHRRLDDVRPWFLQRAFGANTPEGTRFVPKKIRKDGNKTVIEYDVRIPASDRTFLLGYDETDLFISQLPSNVKTVAGAHRVLKPEGLGKNWVRQGEWFFVPVTSQSAIQRIERITKAHPDFLREQGGHYRRDFNLGRTGHMAREFVSLTRWAPFDRDDMELGKCFVRGTIKAARHGSLSLEGWHEVIGNREEFDSAQPNSSSWD